MRRTSKKENDPHNFAKQIIKNSSVKLFMVDNNKQLAKFLKQNGIKIIRGHYYKPLTFPYREN